MFLSPYFLLHRTYSFGRLGVLFIPFYASVSIYHAAKQKYLLRHHFLSSLLIVMHTTNIFKKEEWKFESHTSEDKDISFITTCQPNFIIQICYIQRSSERIRGIECNRSQCKLFKLYICQLAIYG